MKFGMPARRLTMSIRWINEGGRERMAHSPIGRRSSHSNDCTGISAEFAEWHQLWIRWFSAGFVRT
jgi:hypothetical protein